MTMTMDITITMQQVYYFAMHPMPAIKAFTDKSKHSIVRRQLRRSIVISGTLGIIHLN